MALCQSSGSHFTEVAVFLPTGVLVSLLHQHEEKSSITTNKINSVTIKMNSILEKEHRHWNKPSKPHCFFFVLVGSILIRMQPCDSFGKAILPKSPTVAKVTGEIQSNLWHTLPERNPHEIISAIHGNDNDDGYDHTKKEVLMDNSRDCSKGKSSSLNASPIITFKSTGKKINSFGLYYGAVALSLGFFWWIALFHCEIMYRIFDPSRWDPTRSWPHKLDYAWGRSLLKLTNCTPIVYGKENLVILDQQVKDGKPVMFVANHCSWMDIPYVVMATNGAFYKAIAKDELWKVPLLSKTLVLGGHVRSNRDSRQSQIGAYRRCIQWLRKGVNLLVFPEGKLSQTGRLQSFKNGAFQMARKMNVPIVPFTICNAKQVQPPDYVFPVQPSRSVPVTVYIGKPIWTNDRSDKEVCTEVWNAISENLPESQKPNTGTPVCMSD